MSDVLKFLLVATYNLIILAGTTYVVVTYNWSMWTYLLAMCFCFSIRTKSDGDCRTHE
jgi:hypothetical protein